MVMNSVTHWAAWKLVIWTVNHFKDGNDDGDGGYWEQWWQAPKNTILRHLEKVI